ncbi:hypothetical protein [Portibacter lacus]|nr:hypothetical protein [Portibacter lacus]
MKFFRKIRQKFFSENKFSKYLLYALGEILLVVIGILIAIQVSNSNQVRIEQNTMNSYYTELYTTLEADIKEQNESIDQLNALANDLMRCLEIINAKKEDHIDEFKAKIGSLNTAYANDYSMELFDEFMNKGYLSKIEDPQLKRHFESVKIGLIRGKNWDEVLDSDYVNNVSPFIQQNLNYGDFNLPSWLFNENDRPKGGPKVDYSKLFHNLKVWNAIYGRLIYLKSTIKMNNGMLKALVELRTALSEIS